MRWLCVALLAGCDLVIRLDEPPSGHDEDGDRQVDRDDNCPGIANARQEDMDNDDVGDACDPNPNLPGDRIAKFYAFDTTVQPDWVPKAGSWNFIDDQLVYRAGNGFEGIRASNGETFSARYTVEARFRFDNAPVTSEFSVVATFDDLTNDGYFCVLLREQTMDEIHAYRPGPGGDALTSVERLDLTKSYVARLFVDTNKITCDIKSDPPGEGAAASTTVDTPRVGPIGFEGRNSDVSVDYAVVYTR